MTARVPSKGIAIFAWLLMAIGILETVFTFDFYRCTSCSHIFPRGAVIAVFVFSTVSAFSGILVGRGLLRMRERARRAGIVLALLNIGAGVMLDRMAGEDMFSYVYAAVDYVQSVRPVGDPLHLYDHVLTGVSVLIWAVVLLRIGFIIFLILPRIRKQFSWDFRKNGGVVWKNKKIM